MPTFKPCKQFKTAIGTSASAAQSLDSTPYPYAGNNRTRQVRVYARTADMVVKFGDNTVSADKTVTSSAYADRNFFVPAGALEIFDLQTNETHYSVISDDGVTTGSAWVTLGYGEGRQTI